MAILSLDRIRKQFSGIVALDGVSLSVEEGEIHALVGENGAGKSTLMNIVSGVYPHGTFEGEVRLENQARAFRGIRDAEEAGIAIIHQELALVPGLSILDNLFLGHEATNRWGVIERDRQAEAAARLLQRFGVSARPGTLVRELGMGQQQLVEIAKAMLRSARILIFDEPTAALNEAESRNLLEHIRALRAGGTTCVYISHKLEEVLAIADRVTVLRDGRTVATAAAREVDEAWVISRMVGRAMDRLFPWVPKQVGEPVLEVRGWTVRHPALAHRNASEDISLEVRQGEIVGLGGLMGAGRTELALSLLGAYGQRVAGKLRIAGREACPRDPREAIARGLCYLTEDRKGKGLVLAMSVLHNLTLASLGFLAARGVIDTLTELDTARESVRRLRIKASSLERPVRELSGGNQQKVVLAKWLAARPRILILDEPTRGIDVGAKFEIYEHMNRLVTEGSLGILMISSELPELLGICDRIVVMREGRISGEVAREDANPEKVMQYAMGGCR